MNTKRQTYYTDNGITHKGPSLGRTFVNILLELSLMLRLFSIVHTAAIIGFAYYTTARLGIDCIHQAIYCLIITLTLRTLFFVLPSAFTRHPSSQWFSEAKGVFVYHQSSKASEYSIGLLPALIPAGAFFAAEYFSLVDIEVVGFRVSLVCIIILLVLAFVASTKDTKTATGFKTEEEYRREYERATRWYNSCFGAKDDPAGSSNFFAGLNDIEAKSKYRALSKRFHPDNYATGDAEMFRILQEQYKAYREGAKS